MVTLSGSFGFRFRIAKEIGNLVNNLNGSYNDLSKKQAEYLSMETSDDKCGSQLAI